MFSIYTVTKIRFSVYFSVEDTDSLNIKAKCGIICSDICEIEVCYAIIPSETTSPISVNVNSNFIATYEIYPSDYWNWHYVFVSDVKIGTLSSSYDTNTSDPINTKYFPPQNQWTSIEVTYENGTITVKGNGSVKGTTTIQNPPTKFYITNSKNSTKMRNITVKRL